MQGKGVVKFFAILLAAVCIYQLSFTWVAHKVESDARTYAKGNKAKYKAYLDSISTQPVYPVLKHTYQYCQNRELALGLDLQGGMSVTMQVSLRDVIKSLSNNNPDVVFNQALDRADIDSRTSQSDYITLFVNEYEKLNPNGKLASIFSTQGNQDHLKFNASNSQVETYLKEEGDLAVKQTFTVLNTRVNQFGVTQPNIQLLGSHNQILIELPGVTEPDRVRKLLQGTAKLEFYQTYDNSEAYQVLSNVNSLLAAKNKAATKDTSKALATKKDTSKTAALSLLNKVQKSSSKDTSLLNNKAQLAAQNPLLSILQPATGQDQNGQPQLRQGPVVGYAAQKEHG